VCLLITNGAFSQNYWQLNGCVRSIPDPLAINSNVTSSSFQLDTLNGIGYESILLKNGDSLFLKNSGCEYFSVEFTYKSDKELNDPQSVIVDILNIASKVVDFTFGYDEVLNLAEANGIKVGEEYILNPSEITETFTLESIGNHTVSFWFSIGPL
jgi:hypothetical protein